MILITVSEIHSCLCVYVTPACVKLAVYVCCYMVLDMQHDVIIDTGKQPCPLAEACKLLVLLPLLQLVAE